MKLSIEQLREMVESSINEQMSQGSSRYEKLLTDSPLLKKLSNAFAKKLESLGFRLEGIDLEQGSSKKLYNIEHEIKKLENGIIKKIVTIEIQIIDRPHRKKKK